MLAYKCYKRLTFEEIWNILQLWNIVFAIAAVVDQQRKHIIELLARMRRVEFSQLAKHSAPRPPP